ncbi:MAG: DUF192 domain-containing protein [Deltaproteobacteria bacterium]|nr:DUF192 domain-containing protein [Deltaproteobacteria bacterium]
MKIVIMFLSGVLLLTVCSPGMCASLTVAEDAPFRKDGNLSFLRSDGNLIVSIDIEIAETPEMTKRGLMGRRSLDHLSGMLFLFRRVKPRRFWMHNTPLSLDIIFIGEDSCVLNIVRGARPMSDKLHHSKGPVKYVVEVRAGFCERHGIQKGHCITWQKLT